MKIFQLVKLWFRFKSWWLSLVVSIGLKRKIDWNKKIQDMTSIVNDALDTQGFLPGPTGATGAPGTTPLIIPPTPISNHQGIFKRIKDRIRNRKPQPTPNTGPQLW